MTHDPMQTYAMQALGGYPGVTGQFGFQPQPLQMLGVQPGISPLLQGGGISLLQNIPYQNPLLQNPLVAGLQNPLLQQWQNPLQHPLLQHAIQAHLAQQLAAQQLVAQQLAAQQLAAQQLGVQPFGIHPQQISPFAQTGVPYSQVGGQFGVSPLAPQTWVGQGAGYGQIHPLAHLAARGQYTPGITPWAGI